MKKAIAFLCALLCLTTQVFAGAQLPPYSPPVFSYWAGGGGGLLNSPIGSSLQSHVYDQSRLYDTVPSRSNISCLQVAYANWTGSGTGEASPPGPVTISSSLEVNPNSVLVPWAIGDGNQYLVPFLFSGSKTVTIPADGKVWSDPLCFPLAGGQWIFFRTWRQSLAGSVSSLPVNRYMDTAHGDYVMDGQFQGVPLSSSSTATTSISVTLNASFVTPPLRPGSIGLSGTNISAATFDVDNGNGTGSYSGNGISSGTINYSTGALTLTMATATAPNAISAKGQGWWNVAMPDNTMTKAPTSFVSTYTQYGVYGPSAVRYRYVASSSKQPLTFWIDGDSIDFGYGSQYYTQSWATKAIANQAGIIKTAQPSVGTAACNVQSTSWRRIDLATGTYPPDRTILDTATNDIGSGVALATIQAQMTTCAQKFAAATKGGIANLYVTTVPPHTASSSSQTPYGSTALFGPGTVASGSPSVRNAWNAWVYSQIGILWAGVIDIAACVENAPASQTGAGDGQWKSLTYTSDGLHPSELGHQTIAACVQNAAPFIINWLFNRDLDPAANDNTPAFMNKVA